SRGRGRRAPRPARWLADPAPPQRPARDVTAPARMGGAGSGAAAGARLPFCPGASLLVRRTPHEDPVARNPQSKGETTTTAELPRRDLPRKGLAASSLGAALLAAPSLALAQSPAGGVTGPESQIGEIYQLQAAFHRAKSTADLDLMMSLWADD